MTDDEAFLRAIVDAPGDDAPRLVYADWLDERGDSRGAYVRATVIWGSRLLDVETRDKAERQLRHAARGVDPVWVCRVTAPPLGVCCDRVRFYDRGTPISVARVDQLEARLRVRLPADYRAFLLNYNGGIPEPDVFRITYDCFSRAQAFFPLGERLTGSSGKVSDDSLEAYAERINASIGRMTLLPVGAYVSLRRVEENLEEEVGQAEYAWSSIYDACLCIQLDNQEVVDAIVRYDPDTLAARGPVSVGSVAKSLAIFLSQLDELPDHWEPFPW